MRKDNCKELKTGKGQIYPLGVSYDGKNTNIAFSVLDGKQVSFLLYEKEGPNNQEKDPIAKLPFPKEGIVGNLYTMEIRDFNIQDYTYLFLVDGQVVLDPYARRIYGREEFGVRQEDVVITCGYEELEDVSEEKICLPYEDAIGYHLHVRGFTKKDKVKQKGTFAGLREKIPYLKDLGVNLVQLMPCYEFDELNIENKEEKNPFAFVSSMNFWGYGPGNYFAPKASYAQSKDPVQEFLECIKSFHKESIEVVMEIYFTEGLSMQYMEQVLLFWMMKYGIDGFYVHCNGTARQYFVDQPLLARTKLIFADYNSNKSYYEKLEKGDAWKQIGVSNQGFQSDIRCFLKGDFGKSTQAFYRIKANEIDHAVINYIVSHNGFTLADLVSYDYKHNEENGEDNRDGSFENFSWNCGVEGKTRKKKILSLRLQMMKNAFTLLLLSQGTPMIYGGDEVANSQEGNNNAYCQDNEIGWISWNGLKAYDELYGFVRKLIEFRKENKVFHQKLPLRMMDTLSCGYPDVSCHGETPWCEDFEQERHAIGLVYCGDYVGQPEKTYYVAYNMYWEERQFALPRTLKKRKWFRKIDTSLPLKEAILEEQDEVLLEDQSFVTVAPRSIQVYHAKQYEEKEKLEQRKDNNAVLETFKNHYNT